MLRVRFNTDPLDLGSYDERAETHISLLALLQRELPIWPETARLYRGAVAIENDITPQTDAEAAELDETAEGLFYVVTYPGDPVTALVTVVATLVITAAILLFMTPPIPGAGTSTQESPNNSLNDRTNKPRLNGRVPDIFGRVRSTPDLLAVPYRIFKEHREVEIAFFCVGRGEYEISDICDDNTPVTEIDGMQVEVYGPGTSPLSGAPQVVIGDAIADELLNVRRSTAVNGQTLYPSNYKTLVGTDNVRADDGPHKFQIRDTAVFVWPQLFEAGDPVVVTNGTVDGKALSGTYVVASVTNDDLVLDNPAGVNGQWNLVTGATSWYGPTIRVIQDLEVGPFYADIEAGGKLIANVVALNGLYAHDGKKQTSITVDFEIVLTPVDEDGIPTGGTPQTFTGSLVGSGTTKSLRAITVECAPTLSGRFEVKAQRTSDTDYAFEGTIVDEIKLRDLYIANPVGVSHFGDVTTVFAVTYGTDGATAIKERRLNMDACRKVLERNVDNTFGPALIASEDAADIFCHMALDPFIGGRTLAELDVDQIYDTQDEIEAYFGISDCIKFGYTFDQENTSFEEMAQTVAQAVFCTAYRQGSIFRWFFERETEDSILLFNHRNKEPGSETRTIRFGYLNDNDGVELDYVSRADGGKVTIYLPIDQSAAKPKKLQPIGVQYATQARIHAGRAWNKMRYQNTATSFSALEEATQLVLSQRIEVTDNTRPDVFDGHVVSQDGLTLELTQPFEAQPGVDYIIFLQMPDGGLETIPVAAGNDAYHVVLQDPPSFAIIEDPDIAADTIYQITGSADARTSAFLLTEKGMYDRQTLEIQAINYDARYYADDLLYSTP